MFHVKTYLDKSKIHGIGVFSRGNIKKDSLVYTQSEALLLSFTKEEYNELKKEDRKIISHHGYFDNKTSKWVLAGDDIRFCNHSVDSNISLSEDGALKAKRDIKEGEELTQDFNEFEILREELKITKVKL